MSIVTVSGQTPDFDKMQISQHNLFPTHMTTRKDSLLVTEKETSEDDLKFVEETAPMTVPGHQNVLLLFGPRQPYTLTNEWPIPTAQSSDELVVQIHAIGLNPFDWKSAYVSFSLWHHNSMLTIQIGTTTLGFPNFHT